ncbi:MAG: response regulator [bacterium]|nr:response regulator [bacterium]
MENTAKHILMIDDDPIIRRLFGSLLGKAGFEVMYAKNGEEGREMARRLHPDLILLDINLTGEDGYKTADRIKNEPNSTAKDIPVVFFTNMDLPIEMLKLMKEIGVSDYIHKGIDNEEFIERVKKILDITPESKSKTPGTL